MIDGDMNWTELASQAHELDAPSLDQVDRALLVLGQVIATNGPGGDVVLGFRTEHGRDDLLRLIVDVTDQEGWIGERCWVIDGTGRVIVRTSRTTAGER